VNFIIIIFENLLTILLLIYLILIRIKKYSLNSLINIFFAYFFSLFYHIILFYNIFIIKYLLSPFSNNKENLVKSDIKEKIGHEFSISLKEESFFKIHFFSNFFGTIFSIPFLICFIFNRNYFGDWFVFFIKFSETDNKNLRNILNKNCFFFFIPNLFFFVISFVYFIKSWNKEKISNEIRLKNYSIYLILTSFFYLIFPIHFLISKIRNKNFDYKKIVIYLYSNIIILNLLISVFFRLNCFYVQFNLNFYGNYLKNKFLTFFKIFFCCEKIKLIKCLDYNNNFLIQCLSTDYDFLQGGEIATNEINVSLQFKMNASK
jgi:hypothetical protein